MTTGLPLVDVTELRQALSRAVARVCPAWLSAQRDDLVQAAIMRVLHVLNAQSSTAEEHPALSSSYLYKVAYSALVDEIRRVRRRRETELDDAAANTAVATANPERQAAGQEIGRGIQHCLQQLSRERRLAVTLSLQGHSVKEAAGILDWGVKRTENLVYRGLADLRACLKAKGMKP